MLDIKAEFSPVVSAFMQSDARIRHIMGPFRSGKSSGAVVELVRRSAMQKRGPDGYRRSKWMVVRNTMRELRDTTMRTFMNWFPNGTIGDYKETGTTYFIEVDDIRAEVLFRPLDTAQDVKNLLSLEVTGAYFNEVREIAREIIEGVDGRIGQYPAMKDGGPSWCGVWCDTNPPEEGSYLHSMYEGFDPDHPKEKKENGWVVFKQPPAVIKGVDGRWMTNPIAENLNHLISGYYDHQLIGKSDEYVRVNLGSEYGRSKGGLPVHPRFSREIHIAKQSLIPDPRNLLLLSADFGLTPAMVFKQQNAFGQVLTLDEVQVFGAGLERAIEEKVLPIVRSRFDGFEIFVTGDPSGGTGSQGDEVSCVDVFKRYKRKGLGRVKLAWSNSPVHRQGATDHFLSMIVDRGMPAYLVDPRCEGLIRALGGGYMFKKSKDGRHLEGVEKNDHSHIGEACEYGDMYFERGGRRKAEQRERQIITQPEEPNIYATPR